MQIVSKLTPSSESVLLTLGFFDGIHQGHLQLFHQSLQFKQQNPEYHFTLCTFPIPPVSFIKKIQVKTLFTLEERLSCFSEIGVETTYLVPMEKDFFNTPAIHFLKEFLNSCKKLHLIIGEEARFGQDQKGGTIFLTEVQKILGNRFSFDCIPTLNKKNTSTKISSTPLRQYLENGDLNLVNQYLYKPLFLRGEVIHGEKKGRLIGFPTLNITYPLEKIIPPFGVYKSFTVIDGINYHSLTYISDFRLDTISHNPLAETWVSGFNKEIYGKVVDTYLLKLQRPPIKIGSLEELKILLEKDKKTIS